MRYVDAGYAICLAVLALYAVSLVLRRRRLLRADALRADPPRADPPRADATEAPDRSPTPAGSSGP